MSEGASILSYNRKTGEFKTIYTAENAASFCTAVTFGDNVYFGTATADPATPQVILKLDKDGSFTKVYETTGASALRSSCVYDGQIFFGGTDERELVPANADRTPAKLAILKKSGDDDAKWDRVADYRDFGETPYEPVLGGVLGAPIWEMASHNGYIYATAPGSAGFTGLLKIIGRYRYTTDKAFAKKKQAGCKAGVAFYAAYANGTPVYELVKNGVYRYTTNKTEAKSLKSSGYTYKGIAWQAEKV